MEKHFNIPNTPVKWKDSLIYLVVYSAYYLICVFVNANTFLDFTLDIRPLALIASVLGTGVELYIGKTTGELFARRSKKVATTMLALGLLLVIYFTVRQEDLWKGLIVPILFIAGVLISFYQEKKMLKATLLNLTKHMASLIASRLSLTERLKMVDVELEAKTNQRVEQQQEALLAEIRRCESEINRLENLKEEELKSIELLEKDIISTIRKTYGELETAA